MRKYSMLFTLASIMSSCTIKDDGSLGLSDLGWIIIISFIVFITYLTISGVKEEKKTSEALTKKGLRATDFRKIGKYVGGHPNYDKEILGVSVRNEPDKFSFYEQPTSISMPYHRFDIMKENIKSITIEDSSSIEKKVTLGRVLLVGVFALAWRKNKTKEVAFIVIEWSDGRFDHSTIFVNEGKLAMQQANSMRNFLIRLID